MAKSTTINISMPAALTKFVRQRMMRKGYGNTSEYFRDLVRADQRRSEDEAIGALALEGLRSGTPQEATEEWWTELRREVASRLKKRKSA